MSLKKVTYLIPTDAKKLLREYGDMTYTTEFRDTPAREWLEENGFIARHPGNPFGSRCSYYRTPKGMEAWAELQQ